MMPFGLQGAPATFQRMMDRLIHRAADFTAAYLDDLVIYSSTWEDYFRHLCSILVKFCEADLTLQPNQISVSMAWSSVFI